jgi:uncharacterized protein (TIGR02646 family)
MIKVEKDLTDIPKSLKTTKIEKELNDLLKSKDGSSVKRYNGNDVQDKLREIYHQKCCFCESKEKPKNYIKFDIEHYRPKAEVLEDKNHSGYYWLGYEWSNLLWCCHKCNRSHKKTQFPVKNHRIYEPNSDKVKWKANSEELLSEDAYLLHPEIDDIEQHIGFNCNGEIIGKTDRGLKTIEICNLKRLNPERKEVIDDYFQKLENQTKWLFEYIENNKIEINKNVLRLTYETIFSEITEKKNSKYEFSALFKNFCHNFDFFCDETQVIKNQETKNLIKNTFKISSTEMNI